MLMRSSKLFFSNETRLNSGVRLSLELYCVYSRRESCILCYLCFPASRGSFPGVRASNTKKRASAKYLNEICNDIHIHQFTFSTFIFLFPDVVVISDLNKNVGGSTDLVKKAQIGGFAYPRHKS